jgi:pullulanase
MTPAAGRRFLTILVAVFAALAACAPALGAKPESIEARVSPRDFGAEAVLIVHYHRHDARYGGWNLWTWADGAEGSAVGFDYATGFGAYAAIPVDPAAARQGLIVRLNEWESRDVGGDRFVTLDDDGVTEVWLVSGDDRVHTDPAAIDLTVRAVGAFLDGFGTIMLTTSGLLSEAQVRSLEVLRDGQPGAYRARDVRRSSLTATSGVVYEVGLGPEVNPADVALLSLRIPGVGDVTAYARDVLTDPRFTDLDAELGARFAPGATAFRVWSPVSSETDLLLYDPADAPEPTATVPMTRTARGVWEAEVPGDLHGVGYQYRYRSYGKIRVAPDIHCFAATSDHARSIVVDFDRLRPDDEAGEPPILRRPTDEIIYEIHVRDFTIRDPSLAPERRGAYLGLIHQGARSDGTGLAHLLRLGVTAVHLLPIHEFPGDPEEYNWGYWTSFFNAPESGYATVRGDPLLAIRELKTAIGVLHQHGIRVILDVVYNHTSSSGEWSPFHQAVPYYYFRTTVDGSWRNDAGVGNSIADERPMVREFIADSLEFWLAEYRVDGFRFDLVGTHTPESVREWTDRVRAIRPDATMYGEPWTGGGPVQFPKGAQRGMGFAVFNDHYRNAIRGDLDGTSTGFATGPGGDADAIRRGFMGAIDDFTDSPAEAVNYVSAHDNLTFYDKMVHADPAGREAVRRAQQKLALGMVLTSQGIAFLHGGSDFCRTKGGNHNSYNAGDEVNAFDWGRAAEYRSVVDYAAGLIALRRAHPAFRMDDAGLVRRAVTFPFETDGPLVAARIDGKAAGDRWHTIVVAFNGAAGERAFRLPPGRWSVVVDHERAGVETLRHETGRVTLPPFSMMVLHR